MRQTIENKRVVDGVAYLAVSSGLDVTIDAEDWSLVEGKCIYILKLGYVVVRKNGITKYLHRVVMSPAQGQEVDHINCNRLDNRKPNLRACSRIENARNLRRERANNTSGFKGVHYSTANRKWVARICVNFKTKYLGYYSTAEQAHEAYWKAAQKEFGEFARKE